MESYEDLLKGKSLDELLQEAKVLQQKPLDIKILNEVKEQGLEVMVRPAEIDKSHEAVKVVGRKVLHYVGGFFHGFFETCFLIPTMVRRQNEENKEYSNSYDIGYFSGVALPSYSAVFSLGILPIYGYYELISEYPEAGLGLLGTQLTTNALSGLYEWFRYEKNKLKDKGKIKNGIL